MKGESFQFKDYVIKSILANNQFDITGVYDIETLNSRYFMREEYLEIEKLIKEKNIEALKLLPDNVSGEREYLDIMVFKDQGGEGYITTVYDSDALEQDPQVIEIYCL